jgi:2-pyrone-4,6-dicarboxylate lactonase
VLHVSADDLASAAPYLQHLPIPFVIDHMARINAGLGLEQDAFKRLRDLATDPRAWIKISGMDRASASGAPFHDAVPFAQRLVETAPDRLLWGTDWPHPNIKGPVPDDQGLLDLLHLAAPEPKVRERILVDNPARLYFS